MKGVTLFIIIGGSVVLAAVVFMTLRKPPAPVVVAPQGVNRPSSDLLGKAREFIEITKAGKELVESFGFGQKKAMT